MAYYRCVINGQIQGVQSWSVGLWVVTSPDAATPSQSQLDSFAEQVFTDFKAQVVAASPGIQALMSLNVNSLGCKVYDHRMQPSQPAVAIGASSSAAKAGSASQTMPPQVSVVATLRTANTTRRGRGRIYLPLLGLGLTSGKLSSADCTAIATAVANWISAVLLHSLAGSAVDVAVVSTALGEPIENSVLTVRVDNIPDTQRNRRNKVVATASGSATIVAP